MLKSFAFTVLMILVHVLLFSVYARGFSEAIIFLRIFTKKEESMKKKILQGYSTPLFYVSMFFSLLSVVLMPTIAFILLQWIAILYLIYALVAVFSIFYMKNSSIKGIYFPVYPGRTMEIRLKNKTIEKIFFDFPEKMLLADVGVMILAAAIWLIFR